MGDVRSRVLVDLGYDAAGYFEPNDRGAYSVNSITATPDADGSIMVHFGGCGDDRPNCVPIMEGWMYAVRLYRPRPEVLDGSWILSLGPYSRSPARNGPAGAGIQFGSRVRCLGCVVGCAG